MSSNQDLRILERSGAGRAAQAGNARCAASIACSTSSRVAQATRAIVAPVAGSTTSSRSPLLDGVAEPMETAHAGIAAPGEDEPPGAAHTDHLVVDDVGRHAYEGQVTTPLADYLVTRGKRNQVREPLERHRVAVVHRLGDRDFERHDCGRSRCLHGCVRHPYQRPRTAQ